MKVECPRCHTVVDKPATGDPICPTCGFGAPGSGTEGAAIAPAEAHLDTSRPHVAPHTAGTGPAAASEPGGSWTSPGAGAPAPPKQGMAIAALVLGIIGCCVVPLLPSIAATILGGIQLKKIKDQPNEYGGQGMAMTGLILGIIGIILGLVIVIFYGAIFAAVLECEENPDSEFCRELEDSQNPPAVAPAPVAPVLSLLPFVAKPRWYGS